MCGRSEPGGWWSWVTMVQCGWGRTLGPSGLALASAVICWWQSLAAAGAVLCVPYQCCVFLISESLVLSGCLIFQDPLVHGLWEWMTRLMSQMMQLMRSWTASSSQPPKCPVSEWCRGRGSAPGPTGSPVSALELGCGTKPAGTSPSVLYDPRAAGTQRWAPVKCQWDLGGLLGPSTKCFMLDSWYCPLGIRGTTGICSVHFPFLARSPSIHALSPGRSEGPLRTLVCRSGCIGAHCSVLPWMLCWGHIYAPHPASQATSWAVYWFLRGPLLPMKMQKVKPGVASDFMVIRMLK